MAETFADLLREVGIEDNPGYTPGPYRRGYRPGAELPAYRPPRARPQGGSYAQERQFRMEGARDRFLRQGDLGAAGELALDMTGLPALAQAGRAFRAGDAQSGVTEGATGALQLAGTLSPLPNRGLFGRRLGGPVMPSLGANDRGVAERLGAVINRDLTDRYGRPLNDARDPLSAGDYQYWWGRRYMRGRDLGPPRNPAPEQLGEGNVPAYDPMAEAQRRWQGPPQPQAMPRLFGRASDGSVLPMREPQPFRRTAATSGDLAEAAGSGRSLPPGLMRNPTDEDLVRLAERGDEMKYVMDTDNNIYAFSAADMHHNNAMRALRDSGVSVRPLGSGADVTDPDAAGFIWRNPDGSFAHEDANMVESGPFAAFRQRMRPAPQGGPRQ